TETPQKPLDVTKAAADRAAERGLYVASLCHRIVSGNRISEQRAAQYCQ
ncbi:hypothetical protein RRG08_056898, partial [Elysia crispata]